jgi:hypothetical protein
VIFLLYIKCTNDYLEYFEEGSELPNFMKKLMFTYRKLLGKITKSKSNNGEVWLLPDNSWKFKKNLIKFLKIYHVKNLVLSENLKNWKDDLELLDVKVLDGNWLYRYLISDIVEYICKNKNQNINEQNVSIAIKNSKEIDFENIENLAEKTKALNIITKDEQKFKRLTDKLYKEKGIILNNNYNYKRSFLKSNIIINVDLDENEFNKFALPRKAVIINLKEVKIYNKGFSGINVLNYEIELPEKYIDRIVKSDSFNKEVLYESFIYKQTSAKNILREIKKDNLKLTSLIGKNGYINDKEYLKV